jgi:hypothetical protein
MLLSGLGLTTASASVRPALFEGYMSEERFRGDLLDRYQLLQTVLCDRRFNLAAVQVLAALLRRYSKDDRCSWPSIARIALDTGLSRRQVFRALESLESADVIEVDRATGKASTYVPTWESIDVPSLREDDEVSF